MKKSLSEVWRSFLKLFRFLVWYAIAVAAIFYLLPLAGLFVEDKYDAMSSTAKFFAVLGFFFVIGAWQVLSRRDRLRKSFQKKQAG